VDSPQTYGRLNMPVQMIELEEVQTIEVSDEALELSLRVNQEKGLQIFTVYSDPNCR